MKVIKTTICQMSRSACRFCGCACRYCREGTGRSAGWWQSSVCVHRHHGHHYLAPPSPSLPLALTPGSPPPGPSPPSSAERCLSAACSIGWGWSGSAGGSLGSNQSPPPPGPDLPTALGSPAPVSLEWGPVWASPGGVGGLCGAPRGSVGCCPLLGGLAAV